MPNLQLLDIKCLDFPLSNSRRPKGKPRKPYNRPAFPHHRYPDGRKEAHPEVKKELTEAASKDLFCQIAHRVSSDQPYGFTVKLNDRFYNVGETWVKDGKTYCRFAVDTER